MQKSNCETLLCMCVFFFVFCILRLFFFFRRNFIPLYMGQRMSKLILISFDFQSFHIEHHEMYLQLNADRSQKTKFVDNWHVSFAILRQKKIAGKDKFQIKNFITCYIISLIFTCPDPCLFQTALICC